MLSEVKRRLRKYQRETKQAQQLTPIVAGIIRESRYYDELTPQEKEEVIAYWGTDRDTFEVVHGGVFNNYSLHFKIERKPPAPRNRKELNERVDEVKAAFEESIAKYNSPEAKAQLEAEYQELQRLGRLRASAGADADKLYPLPWAGKDLERWERFERERTGTA